MTGYIDISVNISPKMPCWPGSHGVNIELLSDKSKGAFATGSKLDIDIHSGTHIDAPLHHIPGGKTTNDISLDKLNGECLVVDCGDIDSINSTFLEARKPLIDGIKRVLFKTKNSKLWADPHHDFNKEYCALTSDAAKWITKNEISLVGIDYHSIQLYNDPPLTHEILLRDEVVILESINLSDVTEGVYDLICLPIKIDNVEGAPCRALLKK